MSVNDDPSDCGCSEQPARISRRSTLKLLGATALIPAVSAAAAEAKASDRKRVHQTGRARESATASELEFVAQSPLVQKALENLKKYEFDVNTDSPAFSNIAQLGPNSGLQLQGIGSPNRRTGADFLCVADADKQIVLSVQYLIGQCLEALFDVYAVTLTGESLQSQLIKGRPDTVLPGPSQELMWTFPRDPQDILPPPDPLPLVGWPPDDGKTPYWVYMGCDSTEWTEYNGKPTLRCATVKETFSADESRTRMIKLQYPKPVASTVSR